MQPHPKPTQTPGQRWLFGLSLFALGWMTVLLYAGGITTSIEAGMAFLDWPLSNGSLNPEGWTRSQDQLAEHSHRLLGMKVGLVSLVLLVLSHVFKARPAIKRIALLLVVVILFQGLLGGLRVLFDPLNTQSTSNTVTEVFLVLHACGAQITLCVLVTLVLATSQRWSNPTHEWPGENLKTLKRWTRWAVMALFVQLVLGALVRHLKAATVFGSHFPLLTGDWEGWGSLIPPVATLPVMAHYLHRVGAGVVTVLLLLLMHTIWKSPCWRRPLGAWAGVLAVLLMVQITLGALVVWTLRNPHAATFHTLNGAFMLAITWGMLWYAHRKPSEGIPA